MLSTAPQPICHIALESGLGASLEASAATFGEEAMGPLCPTLQALYQKRPFSGACSCC